jgi:hypothetical protein
MFSGGIIANLDAGHPYRHGDDLHFHVAGERKIMNHFGVCSTLNPEQPF